MKTITFYGKLKPLCDASSITFGMKLDKLNNKLSKECEEYEDVIQKIPLILEQKPVWKGFDNHILSWETKVGAVRIRVVSIADLTYRFELTK
jgi:hypothetical protein